MSKQIISRVWVWLDPDPIQTFDLDKSMDFGSGWIQKCKIWSDLNSGQILKFKIRMNSDPKLLDIWRNWDPVSVIYVNGNKNVQKTDLNRFR